MKPRSLLFLSLFLVLTITILSLFTLRPHFASSYSKSSITSSSALLAPTPQPILTVQGRAPIIAANAAYLLDADTRHILIDINGEKPLPMASTTKIMTALIAIQTADLSQLVTIKQDAYDRVHIDGGSSAKLIVGDQLSLKDLLYGLLLPSGDDAAIAISDALGGTDAFAERMNLFAYHLHLFQTHYTTADGLTSDENHHSTAYDLTQLAQYAMHIPLFAQIVQTSGYKLAATAQHQAYDWTTTNILLTTYPGTIGVKTGYTYAAGWCMVFAARHTGHELIGAILDSPSESQRNQDATTLLNWGFSLPLLPPTS